MKYESPRFCCSSEVPELVLEEWGRVYGGGTISGVHIVNFNDCNGGASRIR